MTAEHDALLENLRDTLTAASLVAANFDTSRLSVATLLPISTTRLERLRRPERMEISTFLLDSLQLASLLQDKLSRLILRAAAEDLSGASRLDMRNRLEKFGALLPSREFGAIAEICNRLAHDYPLDPARKAATINEAWRRSTDLIGGFDDMFGYANERFFAGRLTR